MSNDHTELSKRIGRSGEDYLEAIGHLCHKNGSAQVSDIAQMLNVKYLNPTTVPSVMFAIQ